MLMCIQHVRLPKAKLQRFLSAFAKKIGKQSLRINNIIDPALIGGIRLQIGNRIFDSSLANKLERLQRDMLLGS